MENFVIKNLSKNMGKQIIQYFKDLGIGTNSYEGDVCEINGSQSIYYGTINGRFRNYSLDEVQKSNTPILPLPFKYWKEQYWTPNFEAGKYYISKGSTISWFNIFMFSGRYYEDDKKLPYTECYIAHNHFCNYEDWICAYNDEGRYVRPATQEEINWLQACVKAGKYMSKEEALNTRKELPKYWVVKINVGSDLLVVKYLNKKYNTTWQGLWNYYGFDNNGSHNGTNAWDTITNFLNNPTLLTEEEFITYPEVREVLGLDKQLRTIDSIKNNEVVVCITEEEYNAFSKLLNDSGKTWKSGSSYLTTNYWGTWACYFTLGEPFGFKVNEGSWFEVRADNVDGYIITPVSEFIDLKQTNKQETKQNKVMKERFPFKLTLANAKRIMNIACSTWKDTLFTVWGKELILNEYVMINESFYKKMRSACTVAQNELFDDIFGKDNEVPTYEHVMSSFERTYDADLEWNDTSCYSDVILERLQARMKLANVAKFLNKDNNVTIGYYHTIDPSEHIKIASYDASYSHSRIYFNTNDLALQAIKILGEETIKLACLPLNV